MYLVLAAILQRDDVLVVILQEYAPGHNYRLALSIPRPERVER